SSPHGAAARLPPPDPARGRDHAGRAREERLAEPGHRHRHPRAARGARARLPLARSARPPSPPRLAHREGRGDDPLGALPAPGGLHRAPRRAPRGRAGDDRLGALARRRDDGGLEPRRGADALHRPDARRPSRGGGLSRGERRRRSRPTRGLSQGVLPTPLAAVSLTSTRGASTRTCIGAMAWPPRWTTTMTAPECASSGTRTRSASRERSTTSAIAPPTLT